MELNAEFNVGMLKGLRAGVVKLAMVFTNSDGRICVLREAVLSRTVFFLVACPVLLRQAWRKSEISRNAP